MSFLLVISQCRNTLTRVRHVLLYKILQHLEENSKVNCNLFSKTDFQIAKILCKKYNMPHKPRDKKLIPLKFPESMA